MKRNKEELENKNNKFKDFIIWFKESWKVPRRRAGLKLLGYLIFFIVFFIIAGIGSRTNSQVGNSDNINNTTTTTTTINDSYSYKQKLLLENKHFINYEITIAESIYKIDGNINNGILEGYLENNDNIKKIKLENGLLYELSNEEYVNYEVDLNLKFIDVNSIIKVIKSSRAYIEEKDNKKTYTYDMYLDNLSTTYKVYVDEDKINKIEISGDSFNYSLNFDI